jgi:hypothetical protein
LDFAASDLEASALEASALEASALEASALEDLVLEASDLEDLDLASDFDESGLEEPDLVASGGVGVSAYAGNPVLSARLVAKVTDKAVDKTNDKLIDRAVDRKAAARLGWVTAFLRGESSIPLGNRSIRLNMRAKY